MLKSVVITPQMDWTRVDIDPKSEEDVEFILMPRDKESLEKKNPTGIYEFKINLKNSIPFLVEINSGWVKNLYWSGVELLLSSWRFKGKIYVLETIYGKSGTAVESQYLGDGKFISEDGDEWELTELVHWIS